MKTIKYFKLFLICFPFFAMGQSVGKWRAGSANVLSGKVYTLSCFISDPSEDWTYDEKLQMLNKLTEATQWISKQAQKNGVSVSFEGGNFGLQKDIKIDKIERGTSSGKERVDWISVVLKAVGYKNSLEFQQWVQSKTPCKNAQVIIFAKGKGNGYAMAFSSDMNKELYFVEGAILYEKYWTGMELASSSLAHEILHLYGAWDLYKTFQQTQDREEKARQMFANSVMLRTSYDINELNIDEVSAWLIGWNNSPKDWYEWFRPTR